MAIANLLHVGGTACLLFITLWTKVESFAIISPKSRAHSTAASMFTGIIEEMGTVVSLDARDDMVLWDGSTGKGTELVLEADVVLDGAYLGCSICCSGVCLTATELNDKTFKVGLAPETLRRTNLGELQAGDKMNLERASEIGGRNSGHFVQGHVDGVGIIIDKRIDGDSLWIKVEVPDSIDGEDLIKYIVPKGFIAIDGTSLTVVEVNPDEKWFTFMLIEYTQKKIIIPKKEVGGKVNLEVDVLGKYSKNAVLALLPQLEALNARVDSLEADVEADIESLEAEVESLNARVESLEARVESLEARLAEIDI